MGHQIRDGRGQGYLAAVSNDNQLEVLAAGQPIQAYKALRGRSFQAALSGITMNTSEKKVGWLINRNANTVMVMELLMLSSVAKFTATLYGGGGVTGYTSGQTAEIVPNNTHGGSGRASIITAGDAYIGNDLVLSGMFGPMAKFHMGSDMAHQIPFNGVLIMARNNSFALGIQSRGSGGESIEAVMRWWELDLTDIHV